MTTATSETPRRTLLVSALVAFGCATLVSAAVSYFRPLQAMHAAEAYLGELLLAAGLTETGDAEHSRDLAALTRRLEAHTLDLRSGQFNAAIDPWSFDFAAAAATAGGAEDLDAQRDPAKLGRRPNLMPVYLLRDKGELQRIVLSVHGEGMWSTIRAFVALSADTRSIEALVIQTHGETPGIGDRIEDPKWLQGWVGVRPFDADGRVQLGIASSNAQVREAFEVDAISGASVTATSVVTLIGFWLGEDGYGPFLRGLHEEGAL